MKTSAQEHHYLNHRQPSKPPCMAWINSSECRKHCQTCTCLWKEQKHSQGVNTIISLQWRRLCPGGTEQLLKRFQTQTEETANTIRLSLFVWWIYLIWLAFHLLLNLRLQANITIQSMRTGIELLCDKVSSKIWFTLSSGCCHWMAFLWQFESCSVKKREHTFLPCITAFTGWWWTFSLPFRDVTASLFEAHSSLKNKI